MPVLTVTLAQDGQFEDLVTALQRAFEVGLSVQREGHRRIAHAAHQRYQLRAVDRVALLGPALDSEHHTVEAVVDSAELIEWTEGEVLARLEAASIMWNTYRWRENVAGVT